MHWYTITNVSEIDSPSLVLYRDRVKDNILALKSMLNDTDRLRPHVKTNKMSEVCQMLLEAGIHKFKCATIAEAEMLAAVKAPDVLLAHQPVGPKVNRFFSLMTVSPDTVFSCIVDNAGTADILSAAASEANRQLEVLIDVNVGMNRTGIKPEKALELYRYLQTLPGLICRGLHVYDGHIRDVDLAARSKRVNECFEKVTPVIAGITAISGEPPRIVAGGSPSFPVHAGRMGVECSPGTFVFWDGLYKRILPDEPFDHAVLIVTRVISVLDDQLLCLDLGHKSVAAENPFPRVHFLNAPEAEAVSQSEEHLVMKVPDTRVYQVGDVWYGVPLHICPTVALHQHVHVIEAGMAGVKWKVTARDRMINV
ncbi:D-TA family PLP-dependent enzyme [Chitinophaga nivalis]|uniref:D-TA family PLP-dependent enzyme n=1 Tax=Chitinophaga nivalis TaxID=2991709 RepID=A0ABT3IKQ2_9BACT|nr:D-TA family PLP-dependent enzyme [Chitinophaga nivalis]MCW3465919.1 D-TA family PLP-dependent enzyme [Chitinophaga nivalis]MCW3484390.1 D-TA family PLP-dependent enzyme [Chitinophaga nivalis]